MGADSAPSHCGLTRATWLAIVVWALLTAGLITMVGLVEILYLRSNISAPTDALYVVQPEPAVTTYVATAAWSGWAPFPSMLFAHGALRLDNSTAWRSAVMPQPTGIAASEAFGSLRFDTFEFTWERDSLVFLVLGTGTSSPVSANYTALRCAPVRRPQPAFWVGNMDAFGSFNCNFATPLNPVVNDTVFYLVASTGPASTALLFGAKTLSLVMQNLTSLTSGSTSSLHVVGKAALQAGSGMLALGNETLGLGTFLNQRVVLGQYADVAAFLLYVSVILLLEVFVSLLLTSERRRNLGVFAFVAGFAILQDMFVAINFESVVGMPSPDNRACIAVGSFMHLSCLGAIGSYCMASTSVFLLLFRNGKHHSLAYTHRPLLYAVALAVFVLVNYAIVWALRAVPPTGSLSYG
jgi:hypothetical protein